MKSFVKVVEVYTIADYREEVEEMLNLKTLAETFAQEEAERKEREAYEESLSYSWYNDDFWYDTYQRSLDTFGRLLVVMNNEPTLDNFAVLMAQYDEVSDFSKECFGHRVRPTVALTNPEAIRIREIASKMSFKEFFELQKKELEKCRKH